MQFILFGLPILLQAILKQIWHIVQKGFLWVPFSIPVTFSLCDTTTCGSSYSQQLEHLLTFILYLTFYQIFLSFHFWAHLFCSPYASLSMPSLLPHTQLAPITSSPLVPNSVHSMVWGYMLFKTKHGLNLDDHYLIPVKYKHFSTYCMKSVHRTVSTLRHHPVLIQMEDCIALPLICSL